MRLCSTFSVVTLTSSERSLKILTVIPAGRSFLRSTSRILSLTLSVTGLDFSYFRIRTMPWTTSLSVRPAASRPTNPSRGWCPSTTLATWLTRIGIPLYWVMTTLRMSSSFWSTSSARRGAFCGSRGSMPLPNRPIPRTLCDWLPRVRMSPPMLAFDREIASWSCWRVML